ncbi:hypothetical protein [Methanococcus maripaludis]|uniref:Uncharacterized protein n=1 Tax=Methanococcus maripaludis TaxID=39152 RepID=A0A8T4CI96_METMI|nr:hypothetical protein [Methanococcus maripaludis]MBM7408370.1 hypothetical protein [Methanococcus maripaludis]MBP2220040.1 hypothetical protein [Methanococcus maripaludis]
MKKEFIDYLESLNLSTDEIKRIEEIYAFYQSIELFGEIQDIFVKEYTTERGERIYENVVFFSENYVGESKDFTNTDKDNYDMDFIKNKIFHWSINKKNYIFGKSNIGSQLIVTSYLPNKLFLNLRASRSNCDHLYKIFNTYIVPNMEKE